MKSIIDFINEKQNFLIKGHTTKQDADYVDLELPSGNLWATCNIGADKPEDEGLLFQFGRTDGYKYDNKNHKFLSEDDYATTSGTIYKRGDILKLEDDAAHQATKGRFRMPTKEEIKELVEYTDNEWTVLNGVKGMKLVSKKDNSKWIFIPAAGYFYGYYDEFYDSGSGSFVWSSSVNANNSKCADYLALGAGYCGSSSNVRNDGRSVRGVLNK